MIVRPTTGYHYSTDRCSIDFVVESGVAESRFVWRIPKVPPIQYIVEGGHKLSGTIEPSGNKNAALPIIAAALLTEHPVTLTNVPRIRDTETLVKLIRSVGASAEWQERNTLAIHAKEIRAADLDPDLCARIRASILLAGPLLPRCGQGARPPPGR